MTTDWRSYLLVQCIKALILSTVDENLVSNKSCLSKFSNSLLNNNRPIIEVLSQLWDLISFTFIPHVTWSHLSHNQSKNYKVFQIIKYPYGQHSFTPKIFRFSEKTIFFGGEGGTNFFKQIFLQSTKKVFLKIWGCVWSMRKWDCQKEFLYDVDALEYLRNIEEQVKSFWLVINRSQWHTRTYNRKWRKTLTDWSIVKSFLS